jgi:D-3-phosphoglycerate dehydrogenase / 2-oxoglutarate reductase
MRILVTCELPDAALELLRSLATELQYVPDASAQSLREHVSAAGILVVRGLRVSPEIVARARGLQMIVHAGPGTGEIALDEASAQGVFVTHCPDQHAAAIAELTLGLVLALDRRIVDNTLALRSGKWTRPTPGDARGLAGRTLGILGYGAVGLLVAQRARAFDLKVVAWSPAATAAPPGVHEIELCNWPRELARKSDIVTVHAEGDDERGGVVDAEFLQSMPEGACLVHVGQPGAVDEAALAEAVSRRKLRVALDVFASEPAAEHARFHSRLCQLPGVLCTPHIGPLTEQARQATGDEVVRIIRAFLVSGEVLNALNLCDRSPATWQLMLRVRDQVGVMAAILEAIRADGINAEEISSRVFVGAKAAWCTIALNERPSTEALEAIRGLADVLQLELRAVV